MTRYIFTLVTGLVILSTITYSSAAEVTWPRFRGPNGSGFSADTDVPLTWDDRKNIRWKLDLPGPGSSSPIVAGDKVFVTCYSGYGDDSGGSPADLKRHLVCVNADSGKILWSRSVAAELPEDPYRGYLTEHGYASNSPVTDGHHVFAFFGKTGVLAFDMDGKELWRVNVGKESGNRRWGSAASLILYDNTVIVNASEESRSIRALDQATGKEVWKAEASSMELCYSTPVLFDRKDGEQDLILAIPGELWALNPATGKLRYYAETGVDGNVSPSVVLAGKAAYVFGGYPRTASAAVRLGGKGDVTDSNLMWQGNTASYIPSPVPHEGRLYWVSDQGFACCVDAASGEVVYKERVPGAATSGRGKPFYASPLLINGRVYATSRRGGTYIIAAQPVFKVLAHNRIESDSSDFNGTPAVREGNLLMRSNRALYCVGKAASASE